jgi:hypothetical protein
MTPVSIGPVRRPRQRLRYCGRRRRRTNAANGSQTISPYLPSNAGQALFQVGKQAHSLDPWVGFGVFCAYAAAALLAAGVLLTRRDA